MVCREDGESENHIDSTQIGTLNKFNTRNSFITNSLYMLNIGFPSLRGGFDSRIPLQGAYQQKRQLS